MNNQYVAYLRVSTQKQGYSGLGLEAQREIIQKYLRDKIPVAEFVEIESGRKKDRPKLKEALSLCRKTEATLIVAKLDRLARNVSFLSNLLENPHLHRSQSSGIAGLPSCWGSYHREKDSRPCHFA